MKNIAMGFITGVALLSLSMVSEAKSKRSSYTNSQPTGDVEYNATERSPTLPLVQTPPPQNYPNSVVVGAPSYYYYYPQAGYYGGGGYGGGGGYYGNLPVQGGAGFFNVNGNTVKSFWGTAGIPGQVAPYGGGGYGGPGYGPGYGGPGYGPGYGGYGYPYGGNIGFTP
jgi:hypothetical protein